MLPELVMKSSTQVPNSLSITLLTLPMLVLSLVTKSVDVTDTVTLSNAFLLHVPGMPRSPLSPRTPFAPATPVQYEI